MQCYQLCWHKEAGIFCSAVRSPDTRRFGSQCDVARRGQIEPRSQCSVAISADGWGWVWVNASSDFRPHLTHVFKLSPDPDFEAKFWDAIGLYLNPPEQAVVLCCDEKSQIQALQRSQPGLPLGKGHIRTQTHDYYRNGTVTLFAALYYLEGKVISHTAQKHTHPVAGISQASPPRNSFEQAHPH